MCLSTIKLSVGYVWEQPNAPNRQVTERSSVLLLNFIIMKQKFMAFVRICLCLVVHFFKGTRNYVERIPLGFQKPNDTELTLMYDVSIKFVLSVSLCVSVLPQDPTKHILF